MGALREEMLKKIIKKFIPPKILETRRKLLSNILEIKRKYSSRPSKLENKITKFIGGGGGGRIAPYHIKFSENIAPLVKDKNVLEIGGSNFPREVLFEILKAKKWICVDYLENWAKDREASTMGLNELLNSAGKTSDFAVFSLSEAANNLGEHDYIKFHGDATYIPENFYEKFDVVVSINAFEHILTLSQVIEKIFDCLKKGGKFYTSFAPIWSCAEGHHYAGGEYKGVLKGYDISFNNIEKDGVPSFIHLLKDENEMREYFSDKDLPFGQTQVECLCKWSYHTNEINRLFFEDYVEIMEKSQFKNYKIIPFYGRKPDDETFEKLCKKHPKYKRFDVYGVEILAKK